jgi:hypothetical protein
VIHKVPANGSATAEDSAAGKSTAQPTTLKGINL